MEAVIRRAVPADAAALADLRVATSAAMRAGPGPWRQDVPRADLNATGDGAHLYASPGFVPAPHPAMRRSRPEDR